MGSNNNKPYVKEVQFILTNGVTNPARAILDDDTTVILKYFRRDVGKLVLFNEYFCYKLAKAINLPMPKSGVCIIDDKTRDEHSVLMPESFGYAFYSTYISSTIIKQGVIRYLANIDTFYRLLIFDHLIFNTDRNEFNLLTTYTKKDTSFTVIDHSHVFKNGTIWDANCFRYGIEENDYMSKEILAANSKMYNMFFQNMAFQAQVLENEAKFVHDTIDEQLIDDILQDIPLEWLPSEKDIKGLKEYLLYRNEHIFEMSQMIIGERR